MDINNQKEYWDSVAGVKNFTHELDIRLVKRLIGDHQKIIDFGCGYGRIVRQLIDYGFTDVAGYDTSIELINRGKQDTMLPLYQIAEPSNLPAEDNSVDCLLLFAVLTCIPANKAQTELITLLRSKLKPGGIIYISDYYLQENTSEVGCYEYLNGDEENFGVFTLPEGVTFRHHTKGWIAALLKQFVIISETSVDVQTMNGNSAKAFQIIAKK